VPLASLWAPWDAIWGKLAKKTILGGNQRSKEEPPRPWSALNKDQGSTNRTPDPGLRHQDPRSRPQTQEPGLKAEPGPKIRNTSGSETLLVPTARWRIYIYIYIYIYMATSRFSWAGIGSRRGGEVRSVWRQCVPTLVARRWAGCWLQWLPGGGVGLPLAGPRSSQISGTPHEQETVCRSICGDM